MKKILMLALMMLTVGFGRVALAADYSGASTAESPKTTAPAPSTESSADAVAEPAVAPAAPAPVEEAKTDKPADEKPAADNLEFVSGEVSAVDQAAKKVTVKLYGENENVTTEKTVTVAVDESTDITDGETDKDLKALASGTEVDVEYDPATNKATYIFIY